MSSDGPGRAPRPAAELRENELIRQAYLGELKVA
jgi:hypothetical protein